jgi:calcineurin-like phosphoesterase
MTGAHDSVIGLKKEMALKRFLTQIPKSFEVAKGNVQLNGVLLQIDDTSGKAQHIQRLQLRL